MISNFGEKKQGTIRTQNKLTVNQIVLSCAGAVVKLAFYKLIYRLRLVTGGEVWAAPYRNF